MKGITPIVALIILLVIIIVVTGLSFTYLTGVVETAGAGATEQASASSGQLGESFRLEGVSGNIVYIRNTGPSEINSSIFSFYIDNTPVPQEGSTLIPKGAVGTVVLDQAVLSSITIMPDSRLRVTGTNIAQAIKFNETLPVLSGRLEIRMISPDGATVRVNDVIKGSANSTEFLNITLASDNYTLNVSKADYDDYYETPVEILSGKSTQRIVTLAPSAQAGYIEIYANIADASVYLNQSLSGTTDSAGFLNITNTPVGIYTVNITKIYYDDFIDTNVQVNNEQATVVLAQLHYTYILFCDFDDAAFACLNATGQMINPSNTQSIVRHPGFSIQETQPTPNTLFLYHFNEAGGSTAIDATTNNNNGIVGVDVRYTNNSIAETSVNFTGLTTSNITIPHNNIFNTNDFSIEFWVRMTTSSALNRVVIAKKGGTVYPFVVVIQSGYPKFYMNNGTTAVVLILNSGPRVDDNLWHHVVFTRNSTSNDVKRYVDGNLNTNVTAAFTTVFNSTPITIGRTDLYNSFIGTLDEIAFYDRVLTDTEIQNNYNAIVKAVNLNNETDVLEYFGAGLQNTIDTAMRNNGTIEVMLRRDGPAAGRLRSIFDFNLSAGNFSGRYDDTGVTLTRDIQTVTASVNFSQYVWTPFAFTWNSTNMSIYMNNILAASADITGSSITGLSSVLAIGYPPGSGSTNAIFNGTLDRFVMYNYVKKYP